MPLALVRSQPLADRALVARLDADLNIVARVVDLLIVLDVPIPDIAVATHDGETRLTLSRLRVAPHELGVLERRVREMAGARSVVAGER